MKKPIVESGNSRPSIIYFVGPSSGANYIASLKSSVGYGSTVTVFPDDYSKYAILYKKINII